MLLEAWRATHRWQRAAVVAWSVALVFLGGNALLRPYSHSVYPVYAGAGRHWLGTEPLYETASGQEPYRYSPLAAAFFVPFALLPDGPAGLLWRWLGTALFLGGLEWVRRSFWLAALTRPQQGLLFLLPLPFALGNVHNGQANLLVLGLLLLALGAVANGRWNLAAVSVAVACYFKLYPIAVGLLLVALFPRRLGLRLALALVAGFLLPFLLQRPEYVADQYATWIRSLAGDDRQRGSHRYWYRDVRLLCSLWIAPMSYRAYLVLQVSGGSGIAAACLWARRAGLRPTRLLTLVLGLGCCWMTALGPATESSTYVLLGPAAAWLVLAGSTERHPIGLRTLGLVGYGLLVVSQAAATLPGGWGRQLQALGPQPLAALLVSGGFLYLCLRSDIRQTSEPKPNDQFPMTRTPAARVSAI